jgi:hypothetical protein
MANLILRISEIKRLIEIAESRDEDTLVITSAGTVLSNNSNGMGRNGGYIDNLSFLLLDDPWEEGYWKDVRHRFVLKKSSR